MREVWPHGCDNAGLLDPLRQMVKKWKLNPARESGIPVQVEALVTFRFDTKVVASGSTHTTPLIEPKTPSALLAPNHSGLLSPLYPKLLPPQ